MTAKDAPIEKSPPTPQPSTAELSELDLEQVAGGAQFNPKELSVNRINSGDEAGTLKGIKGG